MAEQAMLVAGALGRNEQVVTPTGARARAEVARGRIGVEVAAGEPLDDVVLRSYAMGAAHMAYSWVTSEGLAVDPATGEIHDLTIRSFGVLRASETPPIDVTIVDEPGPPQARGADAVFAAVAAATWLSLGCPDTLPHR
jgi:CO/xanthine dehydrogenase Mo-binding subunit